MKKLLKFFIILAIVAGLGFVIVKAIKKKRVKEAMLPPAKEYAVVVNAFEPKIEDVTLSLPYIAIAKSDEEMIVASKIAARVTKILDVGTKVKKNEVVTKLDDRDIKTKISSLQMNIQATKEELKAKKVALKNTKRAYSRLQKLYKVKGVSKESLETLETKVALLQSSLSLLKAKISTLNNQKRELSILLGYTSIKALNDGVLSKKFVNVGDMAMPGKPLGVISSSKHYLLTRLPKDVKPQALLFHQQTFSLLPLGHSFNGLLEYRTKKSIEGITSDEIVNVKIVVFKGKGLFLPVDALLNQNGKDIVLIFKNGKITPFRVHIIAKGSEGVVIREKELDGKKIIVAKPDILLRLLSGVKVKLRS